MEAKSKEISTASDLNQINEQLQQINADVGQLKYKKMNSSPVFPELMIKQKVKQVQESKQALQQLVKERK